MSLINLPTYTQDLLNRVINETGFSDYSVQIKQGSQPGDGFSSELFSIKITDTASDRELNILCKVAPFNDVRRKEFLSNIFFNHEALFYDKLIPILAKFQNDKHLPIEDQFRAYAKCYATMNDDDNEQHCIIMKDLRPQGFHLWNKTKPVAVDNMRLAMRELGKFHGLSIAMKDQKPNEFAEFKQLTNIVRIFIQSQHVKEILRMSFDRAINALKNEDHKIIMRDFKENISSYLEYCVNNDTTDRFGVLSHGDFWNNNVLYRFNEHSCAEDIRLLDWQCIRYVSPALNLLNYIFTSTDKSLRDLKNENWLKLYYNSLSRTVESLGSNPNELFTLDDLQNELKKCGNYILLIAPIVLQTLLGDSVTNLDETFDKMDKGESGQDIINSLNDTSQ